MKKDDADNFIQGLLREGWVTNAAGEMSAPGAQRPTTIVRPARAKVPPPAASLRPSVALPPPPKKKPAKKGKTVVEERFEETFILPAFASGQVARWRFEAVTLSLDEFTTYLPDFQVTLADGRVEFYEVKGPHVWEDSVIKFKWARTAYPEFKFFMCQWTKKKEWKERQRGKVWPSLVIGDRIPKSAKKKQNP